MRRRKARNRDLFGRVPPVALLGEVPSDEIAARLRRLSEDAYALGLGRAATLIEVAAIVTEMEGELVYRDELDR